MKTLIAGLFLVGATTASAFDSGLYLECTRWTEDSVGKTFVGMAAEQRLPETTWASAYSEGVMRFRFSQGYPPSRIAQFCAEWVADGYVPAPEK